MADMTHHAASLAAAEIVKALLAGDNVKLNGPRADAALNKQLAERDAEYLATLVNEIADRIKASK